MFRHRTYQIKQGYRVRTENAEYIDSPQGDIVYQPDVYGFVAFLVRRGEFRYVIDIGAGNGEKLRDLGDDVEVIAVDYAPNLEALRANLPGAQVLNVDLERGLPDFDPEVLRQAVVVSADVIEHLREPHHYLKGMAQIATVAPYVLVSTPDRTRARGPEDFGPPENPFHVREWSIDELHAVLREYGFACHIGHTTSNTMDLLKSTSLAIGGTLAVAPPAGARATTTALAIMTVYNEADFVARSVEHLLAQGVDVHVVENWSDDGTAEIVEALSQAHPNVTFERFPPARPERHTYEWALLLERVEQIAADDVTHEWIMHNDADELRLSPWRGVTLNEALAFAGAHGFNAIDLTVVDFRPTRDGYDGSTGPDEFFTRFEFTTTFESYFVQIKGWRTDGRIRLADSGGHAAEFEGRRVFPFKFVTKHYPLRSTAQGRKKVFQDRIGRYTEAERAKGWHVQYDEIDADEQFVWPGAGLHRYAPEFFYTEYLVELLSGVGIVR
jgi:glycosyltransferase involved in cell wall biosynthesis